MRSALGSLIKGVEIKDGNVPLTDILARCRIVAGMAGVGLPQNREKVVALFKEWGISEERIHVLTDIELALKMIPKDGIALICGTGSIAKGKKGERVFREGGLGPILGDEGSAHRIGFALIQAIAAEEYRKAEDKERVVNPDIIALKKAIICADVPEMFRVEEIRTLIPRLKEVTPADYARLTPVVFEEASKGNPQALRILHEAAKALDKLIKNLEAEANLADYELHLHGGVFKGPHADLFIDKIRERILKHRDSMAFVTEIRNRSYENPVVAFARTLIKEEK